MASLARARRLYLQQAPSAAVLEEYTSLPDWNGLAMQEQLLHVMQAPHTAGRYRQRLLKQLVACLLYTSPSPRDATLSRMPSSA